MIKAWNFLTKLKKNSNNINNNISNKPSSCLISKNGLKNNEIPQTEIYDNSEKVNKPQSKNKKKQKKTEFSQACQNDLRNNDTMFSENKLEEKINNNNMENQSDVLINQNEAKDIFQNPKVAQFKRNMDKMSSNKINFSSFTSCESQFLETEERSINNNINDNSQYNSVLSFKNLIFDNNQNSLSRSKINNTNNSTNNIINLNQDNSIIKTKRKKENKKENSLNSALENVSKLNSNASTNKKDLNDYDSIFNSNSTCYQTNNNILTSNADKNNRLKETSTNQKTNKKINKNSSFGSNLTYNNSNSTNSENFKFSYRDSISEFIKNDNNKNKNFLKEEPEEDDLFRILQRNVKEANDNRTNAGEKKKRFYENYLI